MQVVYSGGSNTPTPSPRLQRKTGYGRPVMPGYMTHVHPQVLVQRSREKLTEGDITLRDSIPAMSKGVAVTCLVLNIILPGSGTLVSGLSVLCCSQVRPKQDTKRHCIWVNAGVALLQFLLTFLFLLGWIWSITWGLAFLAVSKQFHHEGRERLTDIDGEEGKGHSKGHAQHTAGPLNNLQRQGHTPSGSCASSSGSLNRTATDNARTAHEKDVHNHHHHQQNQHQRHNKGRSSPGHHDTNKQQHASKQGDRHHHQYHHSPQQQRQHHHHHHQQQHDARNHQHKPHHQRNNHYQQAKSNFPERVCLNQDAHNDVAVIPTEEPTSEPTSTHVDGQPQRKPVLTVPPEFTNIATSAAVGDADLANTARAGTTIGTAVQAGHNNIGTATSSTSTDCPIEDAAKNINPASVITIPVAPYSRPDNQKKRRQNDDIALQPIITLQRVPEDSAEITTGGTPVAGVSQWQAPDEKVMRARTRHEKMLQRKMSDNDLSPFELTNHQLAAIIIHDLPIQAPSAVTQSVQEQTVTDGLPKC